MTRPRDAAAGTRPWYGARLGDDDAFMWIMRSRRELVAKIKWWCSLAGKQAPRFRRAFSIVTLHEIATRATPARGKGRRKG